MVTSGFHSEHIWMTPPTQMIACVYYIAIVYFHMYM